MTKSLFSRRSNALSPRRGFTLLEILTSITLALTLMYAVARIFSNVGGSMNETMSSMEMSNALRNAKNRLTADLEATSVTLAPPRNSRRDEGFFCYVEGMGGPFDRVANNFRTVLFPDPNNPDRLVPLPVPGGFQTADFALDSERYSEAVGAIDTTVGDVDDVLSFTAKAPDGQPFRGRFIEPVYQPILDAGGNVVGKQLVNGVPTVIESEYAEIVWFLRGTTLYRRVLPLVSNERLQESFDALAVAAQTVDTAFTGAAYDNIRRGFGFYQFYDVSVHMGAGGTLVANTLGDLSNRENRYFYWNSCGLQLHPDNPAVERVPFQSHGAAGAWYWLRMATLQESAAPNFRAGAPFGRHKNARDTQLLEAFDPSAFDAYWPGELQELSLTADNSTALPEGRYLANALPYKDAPGSTNCFPFVNFWDAPNVWEQIDFETGDLRRNAEDLRANGYNENLTLNQDVILTNVISFNVKAWDDHTNSYVDLGHEISRAFYDSSHPSEILVDDPNDLRSYGRYGQYIVDHGTTKFTGYNGNGVVMPCVYDTWSEQYQRDLYLYDDYRTANGAANRVAGGTIADIPLDATPTSAQLKNYPPPYDVPLKSVQVEIRVFDPRSKAIRQSTFVVDLSKI